MTVPKHVMWFQILLYLSLTLDALSVAFQDRTPTAGISETTVLAANVIAGCMILLFMYLVWLLVSEGVPVKMVLYHGFGHPIDKPKQQRAVMEENLHWFGHYIWGEPFVDGVGPGAAPIDSK